MTKNKAKNKDIGTLIGYLEEEIEGFNLKNNDYPVKIFMNKETKDKLFTELELEPSMNTEKCWKDKKELNYRGIPIEIKEDVYIELMGE